VHLRRSARTRVAKVARSCVTDVRRDGVVQLVYLSRISSRASQRQRRTAKPRT
jgi:ribosomal protein S14